MLYGRLCGLYALMTWWEKGTALHWVESHGGRMWDGHGAKYPDARYRYGWVGEYRYNDKPGQVQSAKLVNNSMWIADRLSRVYLDATKLSLAQLSMWHRKGINQQKHDPTFLIKIRHPLNLFRGNYWDQSSVTGSAKELQRKELSAKEAVRWSTTNKTPLITSHKSTNTHTSTIKGTVYTWWHIIP